MPHSSRKPPSISIPEMLTRPVSDLCLDRESRRRNQDLQSAKIRAFRAELQASALTFVESVIGKS
jgi:hypothetical protein